VIHFWPARNSYPVSVSVSGSALGRREWRAQVGAGLGRAEPCATSRYLTAAAAAVAARFACARALSGPAERRGARPARSVTGRPRLRRPSALARGGASRVAPRAAGGNYPLARTWPNKPSPECSQTRARPAEPIGPELGSASPFPSLCSHLRQLDLIWPPQLERELRVHCERAAGRPASLLERRRHW